MLIDPEKREKERSLFEQERKRVPSLFERAPMIDKEEYLRWIGIDYYDPQLSIGYLKLMPQDFIVEEISPDSVLHNVDTGDLITDISQDGLTYFADLVKVGISTLDAKDQLAELLKIEPKHISFAGIKDRLALTSQRISIRNLTEVDALKNINQENFFIKNKSRGKGVVANGDLRGNRFIITLRTTAPITEEFIAKTQRNLSFIEQNGFWNFFSFQRFGTPRLISHWLGLLLIKGQYEKVVKTFITHTAPRELPYFVNIRKNMEGIWGNWADIQKKISIFPYHFSLENKLVEHLLKNPSDFLGALQLIPDQTRLWMYAYDCFLFNRMLSQLIKKGSIPSQLPLITSFNPRDWEPYREFLDADEVRLPSRSYRDFPFVRVESRTWPTIQKIGIHATDFKDQLALFAFSLPKGSYATTFLANFFTLTTGLPILPGISMEKIDAKELLNLGTLGPTLERFKTVLERREQDITGGVEE